MVVLDDIDRMPSHKVREIFNLVERTAHLPQLIYVMSFDRRVIEPIVADSRAPKRHKRLQQVAFDLTCTHRRRPTTAG
ncbi:P-loop NTPase fold protein [Amycolatopsis sp.]|uniref:P-loop NTPase fold protein n=1 Tax=Amycolatopsis sp. TaxID=37632 RepID=UPI0039C89990